MAVPARVGSTSDTNKGHNREDAMGWESLGNQSQDKGKGDR